MLDSKLLRTNLDMVASKLLRRGFSFDKEYYQQLELKRKSIQQETEDLQAFRNLKSREIGKAKASGNDLRVHYKNTYEVVNVIRVVHGYLVSALIIGYLSDVILSKSVIGILIESASETLVWW